MIEVTLHRRLSETAIPCTGYLDGVPKGKARSSIASFEYWWRWDDDPEMRPEFLGTKEAGFSLSIPFSVRQVTLPGEPFSSGRNIGIYQIAVTKDGRRSDPLIKEGRYYVLHLLAPDVVTYLGGAVTYLSEDVTY